MLLTRLQGQNIADVAVGVVGLTDDAAWQRAHVLGGGGHEAYIWTAEAEWQTEWLGIADSDVCAVFAWALQEGEGHWVDAHDELRFRSVRNLADGGGVFDVAEVVWLLDVDACGVGVNGSFDPFDIGQAVCRWWDDDDFHVVPKGVGLDRREHVWIDRTAGRRLFSAFCHSTWTVLQQLRWRHRKQTRWKHPYR